MARDPEARYKITATDETKPAWDSAKKNANEFAEHFNSIIKGTIVGGALLEAVNSIKEIAAKSIEFGDEIGKAAEKAGIGVKAMSELAYAAKQSDIDLTQVSLAIKNMQVNIAQSDPAMQKLVGNFDAFRKLAPDKQFEVLAGKIADIADPALRAEAAVQAFNRAGADLLPLFSQGAEGIRKAREEAERFHQSFDENQIERLRAADDAIKKMKASFSGLGTTLTAFVAPGISKVNDFLRILLGGADTDERIKAHMEWLQVFASVLGSLPFDSARQQAEAWRKKIAQLQAQQEARKPSAFVEMDPSIKAEMQANFQYLQRLKDAHDQLERKLNPQTQVQMEQNFKWLEQRNHETVDSIKQDARDRAEFEKNIESQIQANWTETQQAQAKSLQESADRFFGQQKAMSVYADEAARNMQDAFANFLFDPFQDGLKGMLKGFIDIIRRMIAEATAAEIFKKMFGDNGTGTGSALGGIIEGIFGAFGGGKASGGPLQQGKWYVAGEKGPEPIWGGGAGAFAAGYGGSNGGGSLTFAPQYNIDARGATPDVIAALPGLLKRTHDQAVATIVDMKRRNKL